MITPAAAGSVAVDDTAPRKRARKKVANVKVAGVVKTREKKVVAPRTRAASPQCGAAPRIGFEERHHLIEVAAYYIAERRGFHGASSHDDWLQAEREVDAMIEAGRFVA